MYQVTHNGAANSYPQPDLLNQLEQELGKHRMTCERKNPRRWTRAKAAIETVKFTFFAAFGSIMITGAIIGVTGLDREFAFFIFGLLFVIANGLFFWISQRLESADYLSLFQEGFACRIGSNSKKVRWDEIHYMGFGQLLTKLEKRLQWIGWAAYVAKPTLKALHDANAKGMVTVFRKDGKRVFIGGILVTFDPEQTRDFFDILLNEYPQLWSEPEEN